jgi:proteasome lid subunit RPN8/RPN11
MARGKVKCPRPGTALRLASGEVVKAAKLDGKVCTRAGIAVEQAGVIRRVEKSEVVGRASKGALGGLTYPRTSERITLGNFPVQKLELKRTKTVVGAKTPDAAVNYIRENLKNAAQEHSGVVLLNTNNEVVGLVPVSVGGLDATAVDPRVVLGAALTAGAPAFILYHNHPSGQTEPSAADVQLTRELWKLAKSMRISMLDHLIITPSGSTSMLSRGMMPLGGLGIEWTGRESVFDFEKPSAARQVTYKVRPAVDPRDWPGMEYGALPSFKEAREALKKNPTGEFVPVDFDGGGQSLTYHRADLEQLLAAEDHYRGIMPTETEFRGLSGLGTAGQPDLPLELDVIKPSSPPTVLKFKVFWYTGDAAVHPDGSRSSVKTIWMSGDFSGRAYISYLKQALRSAPVYVGQRGDAPRGVPIALSPTSNEMRMLYLPEHSVQKLSVWLDQLESKGLNGLGIEWTGKQSVLWPDEGPPQDTTFNVTPIVTGTYATKDASGRWGSALPSLDKIREALEENDELSKADPDFDRDLVQIDGGNWWFRREDLERALAAEDYYRGIMPAETRFDGTARTVTIPAAHLREDVREAKGMVRELQRGIKRDQKALGRLSAPPSDWRVAKTELPHVQVSTVKLDDEYDQPFETMVFRRVGGRGDSSESLETMRYKSRDEAVRGHKQMVLRWQTREVGPSQLFGLPAEHTRLAMRYHYAAHKAQNDVLATGLMATDKPNCIAAAPAIEKLNEVYGRAWAEGVHGENTTLTRERMLQLESAVATLNEAFRRKCVKGFGAFAAEPSP